MNQHDVNNYLSVSIKELTDGQRATVGLLGEMLSLLKEMADGRDQRDKASKEQTDYVIEIFNKLIARLDAIENRIK